MTTANGEDPQADVASRTLGPQLDVAVERYVAAVERALEASATGRLLQLEDLDELVQLEARVTMLYTLLGVVEDRRTR